MFFVCRKRPPHKWGGLNLPIYRDCFVFLIFSHLLQLKAMEKEKNHLFLLLKKSHKSSCSSEIRTHEQDVCALYKKLGIHYVTNTKWNNTIQNFTFWSVQDVH